MLAFRHLILRKPTSQMVKVCQWPRNLFSEEYLGIDVYKKNSNKASIKIMNPDAKKQRIFEMHKNSGIKMLSTNDVLDVLDVIESVEDTQRTIELIKEITANPVRKIDRKAMLVGRMIRYCYVGNHVQEAKDLIQDVNARKVISGPTISIYLCMLFNAEKYQDIADFFKVEVEKNDGVEMNKDECYILLTALYKIGTPEAFEMAMKAYQFEKISSIPSRMLLVLFAANLGECGIALDILSDIKSSFYLSNLKLYVLAKSGRIEDAVDYLNEDFLRSGGKTFEYFYDVINTLSQEVRNIEDMELKAKYTELCIKMDDSAYMISDVTLEDKLISSQERRRENIRRERRLAQEEKRKD